MVLRTVAKCSKVTRTNPTRSPMATPIIPKDGWLARQKMTADLTIAPIKLLIKAAFV